MCVTTAQNVNYQQLEVSSCELSSEESKTTPKEETAEQSVAVPLKKAFLVEESQKHINHHLEGLTGSPGQKKHCLSRRRRRYW